eukprot:GHRR01020572.1.p1 GENE.GHRR01020572.1~~GHRR01020572.1.p1  ORF type:complete len:180 (+),score=41.83 GHRR01020572.1:44-541(+)
MGLVSLRVIAGPAAGAVCTKDSKKLCIGRNKTGTALTINDASVSGKHLELSYYDGDWYALDLKSSNGTYLNDSSSSLLEGQKYQLRSGDKLQLGTETVIQVHLQDTASSEVMTIEEKLTADAKRLAGSIMAAAEGHMQQLRQDWAQQRKLLAASVYSSDQACVSR